MIHTSRITFAFSRNWIHTTNVASISTTELIWCLQVGITFFRFKWHGAIFYWFESIYIYINCVSIWIDIWHGVCFYCVFLFEIASLIKLRSYKATILCIASSVYSDISRISEYQLYNTSFSSHKYLMNLNRFMQIL